MSFSMSTSGSWKGLEDMLKRMGDDSLVRSMLESAGAEGVEALRAATPADSGLAARSWSYRIEGGRGKATVTWYNTDVENGFEVAIALQYGYATGTGGYVAGRDYINPAMKPVFDKIADKVWKAVTGK